MNALDAAGFAGTIHEAAVADVSPVGEAYFAGCIAVASWAREDVEALLPDALRLADRKDGVRDRHPVVFVAGEQSDTAVLFGRMRWPTAYRYFETAAIVPFVRHESGSRLHLHLPRMYAADRVVTWSGNAHYGYAKVHASIERDGDGIVVASGGGERLSARWHGDAPWEPCVPAASAAAHAFASLVSIVRLPVLGRRDDGSFVASYFDWDVSRARVRRARAELSARLAGGAAPAGTCRGSDDGTFEVRGMRWRVSWPGPAAF